MSAANTSENLDPTDPRDLLHSLAELMPQLVWTVDAEGACTWVNPSWSAYTGEPTEAALEHGWVEAMHPEDRSGWREVWSNARDSGEAFEHTFRLRAADGAFHRFRARTPAADARGHRVITAERLEPRSPTPTLSPDDGFRLAHPILDSIYAFVGLLELDGTIVDLNQAPLDVTGANLAEVRGQNFWDTPWWDFAPAQRRELVEACDRAAAGEVVRHDTRCRLVDGQSMIIDFQLAPLRDAEGRITNLVASATDITERTEAREALRASEDRFRRVVETSPFPVMLHAEGGEVLTVNSSWSRLSGYEGELLGSIDAWLEQAYDAEERPPIRDHIATLFEFEEMTAEGEFRFRAADGTRRVWDFYSGPLGTTSDGRRIVISTAADITERKAAEDALRESEERFRALADNMSQFAWISDATGYIYWYNKRWYDYTGTTPEEMAGHGWKKVHHPDHLGRVSEKFRRHIEDEEIWEDTFPLRGADGNYRWFLSRAIPLRDETGRVERWIGTNTDIDRQRHAEEALREADRRKDIFLAMLAHELRNPLAPVRNAVEVLRQLGPAGCDTSQARDLIERQVTHMARLIDDLLDVSRVGRGRIELRREQCDLVDIVRQTAGDYRADFESHGKILELDLPERGLWVEGDRVRLAQVIGNLLHNAGKFTSRGDSARVKVAPSADEQYAVVEIEDTGAGIAAELLPRLFDTFSQREQGLDRSEGGLGLGLSLARGLVELHGGTITAESEGPGRGAVFTVCLPTVEAPAQPARSRPAAEEEQARPLRVVLVEDNPDAAKSLQMLLSLYGHEVTLAADAPAGIAAAREIRPDVVISDIGLPDGMDGYTVAKRLRADPELEDLFLIALSGYGQKADRERSEEAGFDVHLVKPVNWPQLEAVLRQVRPREAGEDS